MSSSPPDRLHLPVVETDDCDFEVFAHTQNPLDIAAATWVIRCSGGLDAQATAELQSWLDADLRHAQAFDDMDATFGEVKKLPSDDVASLKASLARQSGPHAERQSTSARLPAAPAAKPPPAPARPANSGRRQWFAAWGQWFPRAAAVAIGFAVISGGWMGWERWWQQPTFEQSFATERGQQRTVSLPDANVMGSTVQLDTSTRLEARLYRDRREVQLKEGQAMFAVKSDGGRPFHVWAGALRITVVGTRFSVRHTTSGLGAGQTVVAVEEGRVRVSRADSALSQTTEPHPEVLELTAGQTAVASETGHINRTASVSTSAIAPWRDGRISFDQTPLGQAIAEFERYDRTSLVVLDPAVAALPVGGSYSLKQWRRFAETLPQVLPVQLVKRGEVTEVLAR